MCTAATYCTKDHYFGRTLDVDFHCDQCIAVTPRRFPFHFRRVAPLDRHYAMIGMAHVAEGCPLFYDAVNEKGLGMAGLNFVGNAAYHEPALDKDNVASFEFIPWVLGRCASVGEARALLGRLNLTTEQFSDALPNAQLHWIIADRDGAVVVESMADGLHVHDNPAGVLANNPPFEEQMFNLNNYMGLSPSQPKNTFSDKLNLVHYSRGMGGLGLPGDLSSQSRFVRAAFVRLNSRSGDSEEESVSQFFHILGSVDQQRGCCEVGEGKFEITIYTCCCNADKGVFYYTTYDNHQITAVDMRLEDLDAGALITYPLIREEQIRVQNLR